MNKRVAGTVLCAAALLIACAGCRSFWLPQAEAKKDGERHEVNLKGRDLIKPLLLPRASDDIRIEKAGEAK